MGGNLLSPIITLASDVLEDYKRHHPA